MLVLRHFLVLGLFLMSWNTTPQRSCLHGVGLPNIAVAFVPPSALAWMNPVGDRMVWDGMLNWWTNTGSEGLRREAHDGLPATLRPFLQPTPGTCMTPFCFGSSWQSAVLLLLMLPLLLLLLVWSVVHKCVAEGYCCAAGARLLTSSRSALLIRARAKDSTNTPCTLWHSTKFALVRVGGSFRPLGLINCSLRPPTRPFEVPAWSLRVVDSPFSTTCKFPIRFSHVTTTFFLQLCREGSTVEKCGEELRPQCVSK